MFLAVIESLAVDSAQSTNQPTYTRTHARNARAYTQNLFLGTGEAQRGANSAPPTAEVAPCSVGSFSSPATRGIHAHFFLLARNLRTSLRRRKELTQPANAARCNFVLFSLCRLITIYQLQASLLDAFMTSTNCPPAASKKK